MASCRFLVAILRLAISREDVDPRREYTLAELEDEFGAAFIERHLILNQIHVYLSPPELGKGWCVRGNPAERGNQFGWDSGDCVDVDIDVGHTSMCESSTLIVNGNVWAKLQSALAHLQSYNKLGGRPISHRLRSRMLRSNWRMHHSSLPSIHMITLDRETPFEL